MRIPHLTMLVLLQFARMRQQASQQGPASTLPFWAESPGQALLAPVMPGEAAAIDAENRTVLASMTPAQVRMQSFRMKESPS